MKLIYFARHGETDWNLQKKCQGGEIDTILNKNGKEQALKTGIYLNNYQQKDMRFDFVISSPLSRARETTEIICYQLNYPRDKIVYDQNLIEKSYGRVTGKSEMELKQDPKYEMYGKIIDQWRQIKDPIERIQNIGNMEQKLNDILGIETTKHIHARCQVVLNQLLNSDHEKILVVSHGYVMKAFIKLMFNIPWELPMGKLVGEGNCMIMLVQYDHTYRLISAPNNEHLEFVNDTIKC
jgi:broad specificity phosphatase PhoE